MRTCGLLYCHHINQLVVFLLFSTYPTKTMIRDKLPTRNTSTDLGPEHIIDAVYGNQDVFDIDYATMQTPVLRDFGGDYHNDYKIIIPLSAPADVDLSPFVFDVPDDPDLAVETSPLSELAYFYSIVTIEDISDFAGQEVPLEWGRGYPQPDLNALRSDE